MSLLSNMAILGIHASFSGVYLFFHVNVKPKLAGDATPHRLDPEGLFKSREGHPHPWVFQKPQGIRKRIAKYEKERMLMVQKSG